MGVSTRKWRYKPKKKEYGYVSVKAKKIICSILKSGPAFDRPTHVGPVQVDSANSTSVQKWPTVDNSGGVGVQTIGHVGQGLGGCVNIEKGNRAQ